MPPQKDKTIHFLFELGLAGKLLDGCLELLGAALLFFIGSGHLSRWVLAFAERELAEDPDNLLAEIAARVAPHLGANTEWFAVLFLFGHGIVKVGLVVALIRRYRWAYPLAIVVFGLFVVYQIYRYFHTFSMWLLGLSALDLFVIVITWLEYKRMRLASAGNEAA